MFSRRLSRIAIAITLAAAAGAASADLTTATLLTGTVGMSVDGIGSNNSPTGDVQALIPVGATILQAYLYSAGTPFPFYANSPHTLADYNGAGITLAGVPITNFSKLVGATSTRADIGRWFTGRADVTALVKTLTAGALTPNFSWTVDEGAVSNRFDGEVLAIAYSLPGLPQASVAFLDGGQNTAGETTHVNFVGPLPDVSAPSFVAQLGLGISFSCCGNQTSTVDVNGTNLTNFAGNQNDGIPPPGNPDGSLITVGGLGDNPANNVASYADDDELYDLKPFLNTGDTLLTIFTKNPSNDDNIFFASMYITAEVGSITPGVPEPETYALLLTGLAAVGWVAHRRRGPR